MILTFSSRQRVIATSLVACLALVCCAIRDSTESRVDLLITNGRIVDGTGNNWVRGDIAIKDGRILAVGKLGRAETNRAKRVIDAKDRIVAPGFIDTHAHIEFGLFENPTTNNFIHNGVTTVITGNCGGSADSLREFFNRIDTTRVSINVASLVGHNTVRRQVMGLASREATNVEQAKMESLVETAMLEGAVGLSTGLIYLPGVYSTTQEVIGLARAAAKHEGIYASHIRNEGSRVREAIDEALDIGRAAAMTVQISHFKVSAPANWGRSRETLTMIEDARRAGLDVTIDQYPYTASSTALTVMLPEWAMEGGQDAIRQRLADAPTRQRIAAEMLRNAEMNKRPSFAYAVVARHAADPQLNGKNISEINLMRGRPATLAAEIETMLDLLTAGSAQMVFHGMSEDDVRFFMAYRFNMIGADGGVQTGRGMPHPRSYGTNARVLAKYVREEKIVTLEDAIRRMTSLAAQKFQLRDRGLLRQGYAADVVIFDENRVQDRATFENPHQFSEGFDFVIVNGEVTVYDGRHTGVRAGRALRKVSSAASSTSAGR
ncbi:MAG: N-acyl-D-amino-acid deacylase family protein [Burkholderiales bacterium]